MWVIVTRVAIGLVVAGSMAFAADQNDKRKAEQRKRKAEQRKRNG